MSTLFETARLRVRGIEEADAAQLVELVNDPEWLRFIGDRGVRTVEHAVPYIHERRVGRPGATHQGLYVVERAADGAWLGNVSFLQRPYLDDPDIGFAFLAAGRGAGYAYEATLGLLQYLRRRIELPRILAITVRENVRSIRLLEKLGLRFEREIVEDGDPQPVWVYAMDLPADRDPPGLCNPK